MHEHTLYLFITEDEPLRLDRDCKPRFNVVLVFSETMSKTDQRGMVNLYTNARIPITETCLVQGATNLERLHSLMNTVEVDPGQSRLSFWMPGVSGYVSDLNDAFTNAVDNQWSYCHPALNETRGLKPLIFRYDSYPEYHREERACIYTYAPYLPLLAPIVDLQIYGIIKNLLDHYPYASEQAFVEHWIPEALSRQRVLHHPILIKCCTVSADHFKLDFSDNYNEAYRAAYSKVPELYPLCDDLEAYCISLDQPSSQWRKEQFQTSAQKHGLEFEWFSAIDGRSWTADTFPSWVVHRGRRIDWFEPLTGGEVGVATSHKTIWQLAWYSRNEGVLIFEDDAILCKDLDCLGVPVDADILFLNDRAVHNHMGEIQEGTCGTDGYLVTRRGLYKLLQIIEHMNMPLDLLMVANSRSFMQGKSMAYMLRNPLNPMMSCYHQHIYVRHGDRGQSTIGH
jgi:hypothetical protein